MEHIFRNHNKMGDLRIAVVVLSVTAVTVHAACNGEMPLQPQPGASESVSIVVSDPSLGQVERTFSVHLPLGYSPDNDVETPLWLDFHGFGWDVSGHLLTVGTLFHAPAMDDVADEDPDGGFIAVHLDGFAEKTSINLLPISTWNVSGTNGPLGPPCVLPRPEGFESPCFESCPHTCDPQNSCDLSHCYDDVAFARAVVDYVAENYCLDRKSIHLGGYSMGGFFTYYAASRLNDILASIAPNSGCPLLGFGDVPLDPPISIIDFHGLNDFLVPYDVDSPGSLGPGPHDSILTSGQFYYDQNPVVMSRWVNTLNCNNSSSSYPTDMDGVDGWSCVIWSDCVDGKEVVHCNGLYGHDYPFRGENPRYIAGFRILWDFLKNHRKN